MMSIVELIGLSGLAVVAAYAVAWSTHWSWHRGLVRIAGGCTQAATTSGVIATYVSETTPAYFQYVRRRYRYAVQCPVRYCVDGHSGEGFVVDMTREGWRVRGQKGMRPGRVLRLDVMLPGAVGVVSVSRATVCWVRGMEFGVKLEAMDPQPAAQLSEFFSALPPMTAVALKAA